MGAPAGKTRQRAVACMKSRLWRVCQTTELMRTRWQSSWTARRSSAFPILSLQSQLACPSHHKQLQTTNGLRRDTLEELMDDEEEFIQLNLSSRPLREERRKQRERERLEREMAGA